MSETPFSRPAGSANQYNSDPVPNTVPAEDKPTATCKHCPFSVPWDHFGEAQMEQHFREKHPDRI